MMVDPNELGCQELVELVTDYLDDALPALERARFDAHLTECDGCDRYLEQMRQTIQLLGRLTVEQLTPEAQARLLAEFRDWKQEALGPNASSHR